MTKARMLAGGAALLAALCAATPAAAETVSDAQQVASNVASATDDALTPASAVGGVDIGDTGSAPVVIDSGQHAVTLRLPAQGDAVVVGDTTVFAGRAEDSAVAMQPTVDGVRALVQIDSAEAPERYAFRVGGDAASLRLEDDGSVTALDATGQPIGSFEAPWATDADHTPVATRYELDGDRIVQTVDHRDHAYSYPIIADPHWAESISRCYTPSWTNNIIQKLNNGAAVGSMIAALSAGVPFVGWVTTAVSSVIAGGYWILANKFTKELSQSPRRGTCMRAGLKAIDIPGLPDPRYPAIEVSSR
jgi:hypothetical protein